MRSKKMNSNQLQAIYKLKSVDHACIRIGYSNIQYAAQAGLGSNNIEKYCSDDAMNCNK